MSTLYTIGALAPPIQSASSLIHTTTHAQWVDWAHMALVAVGLLCVLTMFVYLIPLICREVWHGIAHSQGNVTGDEVAQALQGGCVHGYPPQLHIRNRGQLRCVVCELSAVRAKLDRDIASLMATRAILAEILANRVDEDGSDRPGATEEENE